MAPDAIHPRFHHLDLKTTRPQEPQTDEALAAIDRVILAITIERVTAVNYLGG